MQPVCFHRVTRHCLDGSILRYCGVSARPSVQLRIGRYAPFSQNRQFTKGRHPNRRRASTADENNTALWDRGTEIKNACANPYPRFSLHPDSMSFEDFRRTYEHVQPTETVEDKSVVLHGRIRSQRTAGSKLVFFDLWQEGEKVQILCNQRILEAAGISTKQFREFYHLLQRGDAYSVVGKPHRTARGEQTLLATELPTLMAPCLHDVPLDTKEHEVSPYERHVQFLAEPKISDILRARSRIVERIRQFFLSQKFIEVNTPIIAAAAGGAVARPFLTTATESPEQPLALRIAPELWLKRLIVGGFDRVFEIGPSFRNEGLDRTHNPEFTTCESYQAFADLECLMKMTENLLLDLSLEIHDLNKKLGTLNLTTVKFENHFHRVDFIPALENATGLALPDLKSDDATAKVIDLFSTLSLPLPDHISLPRLLDKLCAAYLEPQCVEPTFIMNHPECMSPLSKSFVHPVNGQIVSARAELFIEEKEFVNMYEEENSPVEQRRKFQEQLSYRDPENPGDLDESYLQALEWGLPPTGGWGCGIDRLCMLFTGSQRISDVLSFGNLRSVARSQPSQMTSKR